MVVSKRYIHTYNTFQKAILEPEKESIERVPEINSGGM